MREDLNAVGNELNYFVVACEPSSSLCNESKPLKMDTEFIL